MFFFMGGIEAIDWKKASERKANKNTHENLFFHLFLCIHTQ